MNNQITATEYDILNMAVTEFIRDGKITLRCPRCGSPLIFETMGSVEIVRCQNSSCIKSIRRGI